MKASPVASEEPTSVEVSAKAAAAAHGEGGRHQGVGASGTQAERENHAGTA
jgi:hypothetical protein